MKTFLLPPVLPCRTPSALRSRLARLLAGSFCLAAALLNARADPLDHWYWRNAPVPGNSSLRAVVFGNGSWVAVGDGGAIVTSRDAEKWTNPASAATSILTAIAFGNDMFVAVGLNGTILTSPDGVSWTSRTSGTSETLRGVTFALGAFVVVGYSGTILASSDGVNWTAGASGTAKDLTSITYADGIFVAMSSGGIGMTSPDGLQWTSHSLGTGYFMSGVAYGNGAFAAVGDMGTVLTSSDGSHWVIQSAGIVVRVVYGMTYASGTFVAVGGDPYAGTEAILTSTDGIKWTSRSSGTPGPLYGIAYGNGIFVAVGANGTIVQSGQTDLGTITGTVIRSDNNQPLGGATVEAHQNGQTVATTPTDANGTFTLTGLAPGTYDVYATLADFLAQPQSATVQGGATTTENFLMEPKPPAPPIEPTTQTPAQALVNQGLVQGNLKAFVNGSFISPATVDRTKETIVMAHGWNDNPGAWPTSMAEAFIKANVNANLLAWDWSAQAESDTIHFPEVYLRTYPQGELLAKALTNALSLNYDHPIHFIGHSLGTLVNAAAIDYLHGDPPFSQTPLLDQQNTMIQDTLLDDAEFTIINGVIVLLQADYSSIGGPTPIPLHAAWVDNYYSLVGGDHPRSLNLSLCNTELWEPLIADATCRNAISAGAANPMLDWDCLKSIASAWHGYPCTWYTDTISPQSACEFGDIWSFEKNGIQTPYAAGDAYIQQATGECDFTPATLDTRQACQREKLQFFGQQAWSATVAATQVAVQAVNNVTASVIATTASFVNADVINPAQGAATWALQILLQKGSSQTPLTHTGTRPLSTSSPSVYAWVPITIPTNAIGLSFEFCLNGLATNDYFTAGISTQQVLSVESRFVQNGVTNFTGVMDVSSWAGQSVQLFLALNSTNAGTGSITVNSIQFYNLVPPTLNATLSGTNVVLSWPVSASAFALETTGGLMGTNSWSLVTNTPTLVDFHYQLTNPIASGQRFYRLRR